MIYLKIRNGRKEKLSMLLITISFREQYAITKDSNQFYLYQFDRQRLVPLSENSTAVYLTRSIIPLYQM